MKYDYTHKTVFVGIDVHKKTYSVVSICEGEVVKRDTLKATPDTLIRYLKKYFPGGQVKTAYEAGFSGFYLHRALEAEGIKNIVVNAAFIEVSSKDRVKTDKRDALKIASQLSCGKLRSVPIPSEEREAMRELTRMRGDLTKDKVRLGNQIKSLLNKYGHLSPDDTKKVSPRWVVEILNYDCGETVNYRKRDLIERWQDLAKRIKKLDEELANQAKMDKAVEDIYRSVPGVGPVHARVLANELGDMLQFSSMRSLACYTGLTPCEHSSGEHRRLGHISRQGRPMIRNALVQVAWVAVRSNEELRQLFESLAARVGKKRAIIGIARRIACRIRACFESGSFYESQPVAEPKLAA